MEFHPFYTRPCKIDENFPPFLDKHPEKAENIRSKDEIFGKNRNRRNKIEILNKKRNFGQKSKS